MKRNVSIELWRCICMFAVVLGHVVVNNHVETMDGFVWHIPGFLLITGFFGIRFAWIKVLKLMGIVYVCYWLTIPIRGGSIDLLGLALPHGGWFVPFYIVLMILSPMLNAAMSASKDLAITMGVLLLFAWIPCFCPRLSMMRVAGMQGSGLLMMMSIYILGRLFAEHGLLLRINRWLAGGLFVVLIALQVVIYRRFPEAGGHASPLSIVTAFCGFTYVANLRLSFWFSKFVVFIAPSMFGVYLIHECCLRQWQTSDLATRSWGHELVWAMGLFTIALLIDLLRRGLYCVVSRLAVCVKETCHG